MLCNSVALRLVSLIGSKSKCWHIHMNVNGLTDCDKSHVDASHLTMKLSSVKSFNVLYKIADSSLCSGVYRVLLSISIIFIEVLMPHLKIRFN